MRHRMLDEAINQMIDVPASSCSVERAFSVLANMKSGNLKDRALADYWGLAVVGI